MVFGVQGGSDCSEKSVSITMSLWIAIPAAILGFTLGIGNIIKLKKNL